MKIKVFKMAGFWIWICRECPGDPGNQYNTVRDPWAVCSNDAQRHAEMYHGTQEPVESWEVDFR